MAEEPSHRREGEGPSAPAAPAATPADHPGPSGSGGGRGAAGAAGAVPLVPPGFGSPRSGRRRGGRGAGGKAATGGKAAAGSKAAAGGGKAGGDGSRGGRGRGGPRAGRGSLPPGLAGGGGSGPRGPPGGGRGGAGGGGGGGGPPPPGIQLEAQLKQEALREARQAALFKRQVAAMEVSPTMLLRPDVDLRGNILRGGPDVAPASSYEELPAAQHCYWADLLLPDQARLQAPSVAAPRVDHAAAMAAAMRLHEAPPGSGNNSDTVLLNGTLGDFAVDRGTADLLANA